MRELRMVFLGGLLAGPGPALIVAMNGFQLIDLLPYTWLCICAIGLILTRKY